MTTVSDRGGPQRIPRPTLWTPGDPAPWSRLDDSCRRLDAERINAAFAGRTGAPAAVEGSGEVPTAVLVALYPDRNGEVHVILTRRSDTLRYHTGEVSFPGGRAEPGETMLEAALREAAEEVGLDRSWAVPLGELDHLSTVTRRASITPVVAWLPRQPELVASEAEVAVILRVPLRELLDPGVYREEIWGPPEHGHPIHFFELVGDTVWGATAAMLRQMLSIALDLDPGTRAQWDPAGDRADLWVPPDGWTGSAF